MEIGSFFKGFVESMNQPLNRGIYLAIFISGLVPIILHFKVFNHLRGIYSGRIAVDILEKYDGSEAKSYVERYFSNYKIGIFNKLSKKLSIIWTMDLVKMAISLLIILGVIGTFYSLVISFDDIDKAFNNGINIVENSGVANIENSSVGSIGDILKKMSIAFYTSIAGMFFSIVLSISSKIWNTEHLLTNIMYSLEKQIEVDRKVLELQAQENADNIVNETFECLVDTKNGIQSISKSLNSFAEFTSELNNAANSMRMLNQDLDQSIGKYDELFKGFGSLVGSFEKGINDLNSNFDNLFVYFNKIEQEKKDYVINIQEQNKLSTRQLEVIENIKEEVSVSLNNALLKNDWLINRNEELISKIIEVQNDKFDELNRIHDRIFEGSAQLQDKFISDSNNLQEKMFNNSLEIQERISSEINTLNEKLAANNNDLLSKIYSLNHDISSRGMELENISKLLIEEINQGFISNLDEFEKKIDIFNSKLETIVKQIDISLDSNIDKTIRSFASYVDVSEKLLNNKLSAINQLVSIYEKSGDKKIEELFISISNFSNELKQVGRLLKESTHQNRSLGNLSDVPR
ncbi:hypothetical protein [Gudongella oleilytica]|uniref:hypothetical protein n=1 Tax=Gudongella oleilytica TaxID=1582259 RepID=UPI000FF87E58|nr:hypothetical protein [Gudongella oleilytica]